MERQCNCNAIEMRIESKIEFPFSGSFKVQSKEEETCYNYTNSKHFDFND